MLHIAPVHTAAACAQRVSHTLLALQHSPIDICLSGVPDAIGTRRRIRTPPVGADVANAVSIDLAHTCHATLPVAHRTTVGVTLIVIPHSVGAGGGLPADATRADPSGAVLRQEGNITVSEGGQVVESNWRSEFEGTECVSQEQMPANAT
jgi:hypothetical protein